ncbi:CPBP family intramembrane metalloprotease [Chloroflexi bacterium CFX6]|nr:CPBP family intramembrane metalloprotease [Chloroflexi bacterium CFX6]
MIKRHPVLWFYLFAFAVSWAGMMPMMLYGRGSFPFTSPAFNALGGLGPTIAAIIVVVALNGRAGIKELFRPLLWGRVGIQWYLAAFLGMPLLAGTGLIMLSLFNGMTPDWGQFGPWVGVLPIFLINLLSNVWEEIGWRGFALPRLQSRHNALTASLIVGVPWAVWHFPLLFDPAHPMSNFPWYWVVINMTAMSVIYAWFYNNTRGSLLLVTLFHAASNTVAFALNTAIPAEAFALHYQYLTLAIVVAAVVAVLVFGAGSLSRQVDMPVAIQD